MSALEVKNLNCFYQQDQILKNLNIELQDNEIVCLLGESGCGKTTLLRAVSGLQGELSGLICINGNIVNSECVNMPPEKRKVGLIFQDYALFPHLNVFENVAFSLLKMNAKEKKNRVDEVLRLVQLDDFSLRFPHQLSGGQQQRIAIARALAYQPELMLLDEPFSNLDQHVRFQLIKEIRLLLKKHSMSALFVTHSKEEGFAFADKIALMQAGKIVQIGAPQQLYNQPNSRYVADFMGQSNYIDVQVDTSMGLQSDFGTLFSDDLLEHQQGVSLQLLLRPEQIAIKLVTEGRAVITDIDFLGSLQKFTIIFKDKSYIVQQNSGLQRYNIGDRVELSILSHNFVLFNLRSG